MTTLRQAQTLRRCVLVWFALYLGVAMAAPLINPQGVTLICAGAGVPQLVNTDDGTPAGVSHTLDCPLCATSSAPPPVATLTPALPPPCDHALVRIPAVVVAARTAAALPARGPPASS